VKIVLAAFLIQLAQTTLNMSTQTSNETSGEPEAPTRGKRGGRSRGTRGRGTRGRGQEVERPRTTQNTLPTLQQRAAQVAASTAAPLQPLPVQPMPLSQLSAIMDAHFPVEMEPAEYVSHVIIDTCGFVDLCKSVYTACLSVEPKLEEMLSQAEFLLASGYVLTYRVLEVQQDIAPLNLDGYATLKESIRSIPDLPEPLEQYLEGLGLYRDAFGHTICPQLVLPTQNTHGEQTGMLPARPDGDLSTVHWSLGGSMFPYGVLERTIRRQAGDITANLHDRINPNLAGVRDVLLGHFGSGPDTRCRPITAKRREHSFNAAFDNAPEVPSLLRSIKWHTPLYLNYCDFLRRLGTRISCVPYPKTRAGSPAMSTYCMATTPHLTNPSPGYEYCSYMALTNSEQHAARLFRYRRHRIVDADGYVVGDAHRDYALTSGPFGLNGAAPLNLTAIRNYQVYLDHYTRNFLKKM